MPFRPVRRKELRQKNIEWLDALEAKYTEDTLNDLVSRQNQSPDNPILYWANLNWLSREELIALVFTAWLTDSKVIKSLILEAVLPRLEKQQGLSEMEKWNIGRFLSDHVKRGLPFYRSHQKVFFSYLPKRQVLGILGDKKIHRALHRRLKPKLWHQPKPARTQRIRGYRDHGTCRPSHKWKPRDLVSPREAFDAEQLKELHASWLERCLTEPYWNWFWPNPAKRNSA